MSLLINKLVFEVFDHDYCKQNELQNLDSNNFIADQLNLRNAQLIKKKIKTKYFNKFIFIEIFRSLRKNNLIIEFKENNDFFNKFFFIFLCPFFFINPIIAFENKEKIIIRNFFSLKELNIYSDTFHIFLLKIIKNQLLNIYHIKRFKFILINNEHSN